MFQKYTCWYLHSKSFTLLQLSKVCSSWEQLSWRFSFSMWKCGVGNYDHLASKCKNPIKRVNCGKDHLFNECEIWKKEKEVMKIKVTQNLSYFEARKVYEQKPEVTFANIVQSAQIKRPELKTASTQTRKEDTVITSSSKIISPRKKKTPPKSTKTTATTSKPISQSQTSDEKQVESLGLGKEIPLVLDKK